MVHLSPSAKEESVLNVINTEEKQSYSDVPNIHKNSIVGDDLQTNSESGDVMLQIVKNAKIKTKESGTNSIKL